MKTLSWLRVLVGLACVVLVTGCLGTKGPATQPSDQVTTIVVNPETARVLGKAVDADAQVLASALENVQEGGSVIYVDHQGWVYGPDGNLVIIENKPIQLRTKIVAKLRSLQEFSALSGVESAEYEIGGRGYLDKLPDNLKHIDSCPVPLRLKITGLNTADLTDKTAERRRAAAEERAAIFTGMAKVAEARGAAIAQIIKVSTDGTVSIITATGKEIIGRVLGLTPIEMAIGAGAKMYEISVQTDAGKVEKAVATADVAADLLK